MKFLKALFGKSTAPRAGGAVRKYLTSEIERLERKQLNFTDSFSRAVFGPIECFAIRDGSAIEGLESYISDAALFELACYTLTSCDVWVFAHAPQARQKMMGVLNSRFTKIFQTPLGLSDPELARLVEDRMAVYGRLFASRADAQTLHSSVTFAMHNTVKRGSLTAGAAESIPIVSALLDHALKMELVEWDKRFLPHTLDALEQGAAAISSSL